MPGRGLLSLLHNGTCEAKNTNLNYNAGLWSLCSLYEKLRSHLSRIYSLQIEGGGEAKVPYCSARISQPLSDDLRDKRCATVRTLVYLRLRI